MADDRPEGAARLRELEERLRVLEGENDLLAEAQADEVFLGTLADHLGRAYDWMAALRDALETISVLKDLPVCAALEPREDGFEVVTAHLATSHLPLEGARVVLSPECRRALAAGPVVLEGAAAAAALPACPAFAGFRARAALVVPFAVRGRPTGALLLCSEGPPERLRAALPVLQRAVEAVRGRLDHLALEESLRQLAAELDRKVVDRTRELAASEAHLRAALEAVSMGTFAWDLDTGAVAWSGVSELLGLGLGALAPDLGGYLANVHPEDRPDVEGALEYARRTGGQERVRIEHRIVGPPPRILELSGRAVPSAAGEHRRIAGVVVDVTERRGLEQDLLQARKMESIGRLAGGIAHDFNNLLTTILGGAEVVLDGASLQGAEREDLVAVRDAARRAAELTRRLLAFSRKQDLAIRAVDLEELTTGLAPLLQRLMGTDVSLRLQIAPGLPRVSGDPAQLEQILLNFAANARDAMPKGGSLSITLSPAVVGPGAVSPAPGRYVRLVVADTGVGMPAEVVARVFEPFFTTKVRGEGTGLGLAIVYGVVKQHGGAISVTSAPGAGTRFDVLFPVAEAPAP